ncbi:MAG: multifunctional CCA addition/repair protein, partial [Thiohalomonadales bacterium]
LTPTERDWVVVGSCPDDLLAQGYTAVGNSFPVFLHPDNKEEYALARTEKKTGPGYTGFEVHFAENVTLEQDLQRRDLTINAIARNREGDLVDPFHGHDDLNKRLLRHVSDAFGEDPVRILRIARFTAQLGAFDFKIAPDTLLLLKDMVNNGEVDSLVPERVWKETSKALLSHYPERYFTSLRDCGALARLFPEVDRLFGVPQTATYHPEIDSGIHTMMALQQATLLSDDLSVRFATLVHDLGKGATPKAILPRHTEHEKRGMPLVEGLCDRLRVPTELRRLALKVTEHHLLYHRAFELRPKTLVKLLNQLDAYRKPQLFNQFILACEADSRGRTGFEHSDCEQSHYLRRVLATATKVNVKPLLDKGLQGLDIKHALDDSRRAAIAKEIAQ